MERTVFETHIPDNNGLSLFFCVAFPFGRFFDGLAKLLFEKRCLAKRALVLCEIAGLFAMRSAIFGNISPIMTVFCCFPAPATTGTLRSLPLRRFLAGCASRPSAFPGSWMIRLKKRRKRRRRGRLFPCAVFSSGRFPRAIGRNCFARQTAAEPLFRAGRVFFPKRKICSILYSLLRMKALLASFPPPGLRVFRRSGREKPRKRVFRFK